MATIDTIADRSTGSAIAGKAYFETSTNKFIVYNGSAWIELDSDGVGAFYANRWGASFDESSDYLDIPDSTALETTAFTWSAWFYCTAIDKYHIIVDSTTNTQTANGYVIFVRDSTNKIEFGSYSSVDYIASSTTVSTNTWYHVAATHELGSDKLYVNGTHEASGLASNFQVTDAANLRIGSSLTFNLHHTGLIDEVAFFNTALSEPDIAKIYNGTAPDGKPTDLTKATSYDTDRTSNLKGYWRMGDDSNDSPSSDPSSNNISTITDSSGNGNDATQSVANNQPTFKALDQSTTSLSFDKTSTDGLQTPAGTFNLGNSPFTFSVWFKASSLAANYHAVFKAGSGASAATMFITSGGDVQFSDWSNVQISSGFTVTTGAWHHAAFVKSTAGSTSIDMYVDGIFRSSGSLTTSDFTGSNNTIGHIGNGGSTWPYDGEIDEFAFWDTALSASNIASLAASRGAHIINDLSLSPVAYYRMGEDDSLTDGQTGISQITDASGNGNHATQSVAANQPTASVDPVIYV